MERRLSRFIPLVRFYHVTSEDFLLKVYPFIELLPNDLINSIFAHHMSTNNRLVIDIRPVITNSSIITSQHFVIFDSWIRKKDNFYYNVRNIPYKFKLLYRASKDGNTGATFHEKCDNKGPTIVIAKIANSEQIVGGYNPLDWKPTGYKSTKDSFIFSFTDRNNLKTAKVGYPSTNHQYFIYCYSNRGPVFGGSHDLACYNHC